MEKHLTGQLVLSGVPLRLIIYSPNNAVIAGSVILLSRGPFPLLRFSSNRLSY